MNHNQQYTFNFSALILAAIPSYIFPFFMSFLSGYFREDHALMVASYTTIGLSSLLSTIGSFIVLWQFDLRQILVQDRWKKALLIISSMSCISVFYALLFHPFSSFFNIVISAFIGTTIVTIRQIITKHKYERN